MRFFILDPAPTGTNEGARTDVVLEEGARYGDAPHCAACGKFTGMIAWLPPYHVGLETWGTQFGDLAFSGAPGWLLGSKRFRKLCSDNRVTGLTDRGQVNVNHVIPHHQLNGDPPEYYKFDVIQSQSRIDQEASGFEWVDPPSCPVCHLGSVIKRWRQIVVATSSWGGEDIFIAQGLPGTYIVTERFQHLCRTAGIQNAMFIAAEDYAHDDFPWEQRGESDTPK